MMTAIVDRSPHAGSAQRQPLSQQGKHAKYSLIDERFSRLALKPREQANHAARPVRRQCNARSSSPSYGARGRDGAAAIGRQATEIPLATWHSATRPYRHHSSACDQAPKRHIRIGECLQVDRGFRLDQSLSRTDLSRIVGGRDADYRAVHC